MAIEDHENMSINEIANLAANAIIRGIVNIGHNVRIFFGAVIAEGGRIEVEITKNGVIPAIEEHACVIKDRVLIDLRHTFQLCCRREVPTYSGTKLNDLVCGNRALVKTLLSPLSGHGKSYLFKSKLLGAVNENS